MYRYSHHIHKSRNAECLHYYYTAKTIQLSLPNWRDFPTGVLYTITPGLAVHHHVHLKFTLFGLDITIMN